MKEADPDEYRSVEYIIGLKEVPEVLNQFYSWAIHPEDRMSKLDRMNKMLGERDWDIDDTWGMINDGNHRAIAEILASDLEEIECFVGCQ